LRMQRDVMSKKRDSTQCKISKSQHL